MATVGRIIAGARIERGMKQEDLAAAVGVSKSAVHQWENGTSMPRMHLRAHIAQALGIDKALLMPEMADVIPAREQPRDIATEISEMRSRLEVLAGGEGRGDGAEGYPGIEALLQDPALRQALHITDDEAEALRSVSVGTHHSIETVDQAVALLSLLRTWQRR